MNEMIVARIDLEIRGSLLLCRSGCVKRRVRQDKYTYQVRGGLRHVCKDVIVRLIGSTIEDPGQGCLHPGAPCSRPQGSAALL